MVDTESLSAEGTLPASVKGLHIRCRKRDREQGCCRDQCQRDNDLADAGHSLS